MFGEGTWLGLKAGWQPFSDGPESTIAVKLPELLMNFGENMHVTEVKKNTFDYNA